MQMKKRKYFIEMMILKKRIFARKTLFTFAHFSIYFFMKKYFDFFIFFFMKYTFFLICLFLILPLQSFAEYKMENASKNLIKKYHFSTQNLDKPISRQEFVETLFDWYKDYKAQKWILIDTKKYKKIDNSKYFVDIDMNSSFWKKLWYFASLWTFSQRKYFYPKWKVSQKDFFTVMKRLKIIFWLKNCIYHKICEKEANEKTKFTKWTYYRYVSRILNPKLRKYGNTSSWYIKQWYQPFLSPKYRFPIKPQTLNGCYAFSVRNILKYKYGIGVNVSKGEKMIKKPPKSLWWPHMMSAYDRLVHIEKKSLYHIDTLIHSLQAGEPIAITYWLEYYSHKDRKKKKVLHIVAAYSFDTKGVWVAETVSHQYKRVPWNKIFNVFGTVGYRRMFHYYYEPKNLWTQSQKDFEKQHNILVSEF